MFFRSVCNPIYVGLGTAAIFAAGATPAMAAGPSPSPSPKITKSSPAASQTPSAEPEPQAPSTPSKPPKPKPTPTPSKTTTAPVPSPTAGPRPPVLYVNLSVPGGRIRSGDSVTAAVHVHATTAKARRTVLRLAAGGSPTPAVSKCTTAKGLCNLGVVGESARVVYATVQIPKNIKSGSVTLTATVSAEGALTKTDGRTIPVTKAIVKPKTPKATETPAGSGGSGSGGTGSGGTGSGTTGGTGTGGGGYTPPSTNGTFNPSKPPQVALPPIAPPAPSVAPGQTPAVQTSTLRSNDTRATQQLTFERMASTQAAWLAALMVAFSLLLTQIRLGRRSGVPRSAKGTHRRSRRGAFSR